MRSGIIINQSVDFCSGHSGMNFFFHKVEHTGVDHSAASDTLDLLGCFNQIAARHYMSALLVEHHFAVELSGLYTLWHHPISFENLHSPQK